MTEKASHEKSAGNALERPLRDSSSSLSSSAGVAISFEVSHFTYFQELLAELNGPDEEAGEMPFAQRLQERLVQKHIDKGRIRKRDVRCGAGRGDGSATATSRPAYSFSSIDSRPEADRAGGS